MDNSARQGADWKFKGFSVNVRMESSCVLREGFYNEFPCLLAAFMVEMFSADRTLNRMRTRIQVV